MLQFALHDIHIGLVQHDDIFKVLIGYYDSKRSSDPTNDSTKLRVSGNIRTGDHASVLRDIHNRASSTKTQS